MLYEPKACRACAKAKRKCDKELPACLRCRSRGVVCDYPPTRPGTFVALYVTRLQEWVDQWASRGACPFIHSRLYIARFPDCLQIAMMTQTTYRNRTLQNTDLILKIVEDQASKLVDEAIQNGCDPALSLSLLDQMARLHALVIYQTISLFDGDIRTRHLAEARLPLLSRWAQQLLESARQKFSSTPAVLDMTVALHLGPMDSEEHPWYLWILTESIRRTWLIAGGLEAIYSMLQRGWHPCPGGIMFTTRQGIWDAPSALAWEESCFARGKTPESVGFIHRFETSRLFQTSTPDDIDDFTDLMMEITYGAERMHKWKQENRQSRDRDNAANGSKNGNVPAT
ncbi:hypothetical protein SEUCBS140593_006668 [Sporothrix eucalyptigena]|uniref:Zn(2)-C6 fungal-type domain-containing protein n=1 Tax=Sporothrix eucalyptigena TaxID=1812306 RepID=A0ABP0C6S4_9PEZI